MKCANRIHTWGQVRGKSSKKWLSKYLLNRVINRHIKLFHPGEAIMVLLKKQKSNGEQSEKIEMFS
jgi:hypothetical protein